MILLYQEKALDIAAVSFYSVAAESLPFLDGKYLHDA